MLKWLNICILMNYKDYDLDVEVEVEEWRHSIVLQHSVVTLRFETFLGEMLWADVAVLCGLEVVAPQCCHPFTTNNGACQRESAKKSNNHITLQHLYRNILKAMWKILPILQDLNFNVTILLYVMSPWGVKLVRWQKRTAFPRILCATRGNWSHPTRL